MLDSGQVKLLLPSGTNSRRRKPAHSDQRGWEAEAGSRFVSTVPKDSGNCQLPNTPASALGIGPDSTDTLLLPSLSMFLPAQPPPT